MKYIFTIIATYFIGVSIGYASTISLKVPEEEAFVGTKISVDVFLDSEGVSFNSVEMSITYPETLLFAGYAQSDIIPIWIVPPNADKGVVHFSGIIPGGVDRMYDPDNATNRTLRIIKLFFVPQTSGDATFRVLNNQILQNDGKGTPLVFDSYPKTILIKEKSKNVNVYSEKEEDLDTHPPESFTIKVIKSPFLGRTPRLAVFGAIDSETGISHYEVKVGSKWKGISQSPYPLPYRIFSYTFVVRAFDFSQNYKDETVTIPGSVSYVLVIVIGLGTIGGLFYTYYIRRKRHEIDQNHSQ